MKKIVGIGCSVVLVALVVVLALVLPKEQIVYATNIVCNSAGITIEVGKTYRLSDADFSVAPANYSERLVFTSDDQSVATVDIFAGEITGVSVGTCNIVVTVKTSGSQTKSCKILLNVVEQKEYPLNVEISTTNVTIVKDHYLVLNTVITGLTNTTPKIYIQNNKIEYDFATDKIFGREVGEDNLTLVYTLKDGTTKQFDILVEVTQKGYSEQTLTYSKTEQYVSLSYETTSPHQNCTLTIESGGEVVAILIHDYKNFVVELLSTGTAKIVMNSPTNTCVYFVVVV